MVQVLKGEVCSSKGQRKKRSHSSLDAASTDEQFVCTGTSLLTVDVWIKVVQFTKNFNCEVNLQIVSNN